MNVLVVYYNRAYPMRRSVRDHLLAFRRYLPHRVDYVNAAARSARHSRHLTQGARTYDAVVLHTTLLSLRWYRPLLDECIARVTAIADWPAATIAFPQDEFFDTATLEDLFTRFDVSHVFSVAPRSEWGLLYPSVGPRVDLHDVLTGYLDDSLVAYGADLVAGGSPRPIDIGYRARNPQPWLGRVGRLKAEVAERFLALDPPGLTLDISLRAEDTLLADEWLRFLARSRTTLGSPSGASIFDRDGTLRDRTQAFMEAHPGATFDEIEAACFPGRDGELRLDVVGPRHLEAAATRTCQVLVRGGYNGLLEPGTHYVAIEPDFANLDDVVEQIRDHPHCARIADATHRDIVESGRWTYRSLIEGRVVPVLDELPAVASRHPSAGRAAGRAQHAAGNLALAVRTGSPRALSRTLTKLGIRVREDQVRGGIQRVRGMVSRIVHPPTRGGTAE